MTEKKPEFRIVAEGSVPSPAAEPDKFTGDAWQADILPAQQDEGLRGLRFTYAPGARSYWHVHTGEQALVAVSGRGLVQWEGEAAPRTLEPGDWVHVVPGVAHWHGAAPDSTFVHLAVNATGTTEWGGEVTDEQYRA
ncbi:cupin domain-containing protein [Actinoplanes sp. NBC_00393]|uniref:cupin domain-containing protein n=1 Tax=Actinoplanes sp. NBC_00393 TaxID=2975953 RepID=UPI002E2226CB